MIQVTRALSPKLVDQVIEKARLLRTSETARQIETMMCAANPAYFIWNAQRYVKTFDVMDKGGNKVKPFPYKDYLWYVLYHIHYGESPIFVPKSRQIIITWLVCAYILWLVRFHPFELAFVQSKKEVDAANLVFNKDMLSARISFMEANLPEWMQDDGLTTSFGVLLYSNGSKVWGVPQGADILRSYTASFLFMDEAAFQPRASESYKAASQSAHKIVAVSSANPSFFGETCGLQQSFQHRPAFLPE